MDKNNNLVEDKQGKKGLCGSLELEACSSKSAVVKSCKHTTTLLPSFSAGAVVARARRERQKLGGAKLNAVTDPRIKLGANCQDFTRVF